MLDLLYYLRRKSYFPSVDFECEIESDDRFLIFYVIFFIVQVT